MELPESLRAVSCCYAGLIKLRDASGALPGYANEFFHRQLLIE